MQSLAEPTTPSSRRPKRSRWLGVALAAVMITAIVVRRRAFARAWHEVSSISGAGLAVLVGLTIVQALARAWSVRSTLPGLPMRRAVLVSEANLAASNGVLGGAMLGVGIKATMLRSWGVTSEAVALSVVASGVTTSFVMWFLALAVAVAGLATGQDGTGRLAIIGVSLAVLSGATIMWWLLLCRERVSDSLARFGDRMMGRVRRRVERLPQLHLADGVSRYRADGRSLVRNHLGTILFSTAVSHAMAGVVLIATLRIVGVSGTALTPLEVVSALAFVRVAASFAPFPGGVGVTEFALANLLVAAGGPASKVLAAVLVFRAATYLLPIVSGTVSIVVWRRSASREGLQELLDRDVADGHASIESIEAEETSQWLGIPSPVERALEAGTASTSALAHADGLGAVEGHLSGPEAVEAHQRTLAVAKHGTPMNGSADHRCPYVAEPVKGAADIVAPQRVAGWEQHVEPQDVGGSQPHGTTPASPFDDLDAHGLGLIMVDETVGLG